MAETNKLDDKKICIITCVNDEKMYREACLYLSKLHIPEGMSVDLLGVRDAASMTSGYQAAMKASDAKYKIYMHQDVMLVEKNILQVMVQIFQSDATIGMMGLIGAKKLEKNNPCWWLGTEQWGAIVNQGYPEKAQSAVLYPSEAPYMDLEALDGAFLATQYDLPWRTDLFDGWHFYDTSQTLEYRRHGYQTVIPRQTHPWFVHCNGTKLPEGDYAESMEIFYREYREFLGWA